MKNLNIKTFLYILLGFSAVAWFMLAFFSGLELSSFWSFLKLLPTVATVDLIIFGFFVQWGWRWKLFQGWLVPFPDLNGTWEGIINSSWKNPESGEKATGIPVILTIKQSFMKISCVLQTAEMISRSYVEGFFLDADKQLKQLAYFYTSKPKPSVRDRSETHDGAIVFDIIVEPKLKLRGCYWTDRKSTGEIILKFRGKKILQEIPKNFNPHPVSGKTID